MTNHAVLARTLPGPFAPRRDAPMRRGDHVRGSPWTVVRPLGQGGMGEVFEVEHALLGRRAALKILHRDHRGRDDLAARLYDEARMLASVRHDNLVDVLDLGVVEGDGRPYLVMELLSGRDLRSELLRVGAFSVPAAVDIVIDALRGLSVLHEAGIVHRDIKPENLFLCDDGRVKVLDLGVAEILGGEVMFARGGPSLGTPRTMAPEQCEGRPVGPPADLYAMGLVLYELVSGRGPFDNVDGIDALRFAHGQRKPPPPSRIAPQAIPANVEAIILRALEKSPEDRFPSAAAMAAALREARPGAPGPRGGRLSLVHSATIPSASLGHAIAPAAATKAEGFAPGPQLLTRPPSSSPVPPPASTLRPVVASRHACATTREPTSLRAAVSALAIAALALGLALGRLLPHDAPAVASPAAAAR
ncbi:serine/threonine-protein kinase [Polyangium aurulentum]|uniref:serine/threonine-protein kinase n=1 Tax=Polyangium aurulentum TaxID=2567896 RepID=UPI0010AE2B4B|nr:serine/threonine-protein kinase [Polyangium aurulentum]UQA60935.1 serine/threonine protein kinase [Polyangium aurulentum]